MLQNDRCKKTISLSQAQLKKQFFQWAVMPEVPQPVKEHQSSENSNIELIYDVLY